MQKLFYVIAILVMAMPAAAQAAPKTQEELAASYRQFREQNNCDGILSLVYTEGVSAEHLALVKTQMCDFMSLPVASIEFQPVDPASTQPFSYNGKTYALTLTPINSMKVSFAKTNEKAQANSMTALIGQKDGVFYIVTSKVVSEQ
jgi:hypothetical protein